MLICSTCIVELNICRNICIQRKGEEGESRKRKRIKQNEAVWRVIMLCVQVLSLCFLRSLCIWFFFYFICSCTWLHALLYLSSVVYVKYLETVAFITMLESHAIHMIVHMQRQPFKTILSTVIGLDITCVHMYLYKSCIHECFINMQV